MASNFTELQTFLIKWFMSRPHGGVCLIRSRGKTDLEPRNGRIDRKTRRDESKAIPYKI